MPGFEQTKPMRKMGMHSSPTGMLFLTDVRVGKDRLLGETEDVPYREGAKEAFSIERVGVAAMSLGIIERCLELSLEYAKTCVRFGKPIGEHQLIQEKLAKMEMHRLNVENMVFRSIEKSSAGAAMTLSEASVMKLYSARAAMEVRSRRFSFTVATATWPSSRSSSWPATPRCSRSTPAPTRSRSAKSLATSSPDPCSPPIDTRFAGPGLRIACAIGWGTREGWV